MQIPEGIFKSYDIRGIYPAELNEENIVSITRAVYKFLLGSSENSKGLKIVVGQDMRLSSPSLFEVVSKTLTEVGAEVIDIGVVSTPTFYYAVFSGGYDGGIQISASHNPKDYNGLKMVKNSPKGLIKIGKSTGMEDIKKMSLEGVNLDDSKKGIITKKEGILDDEVNNAIKIAGNPKVDKFKIVADAANAMGATYIDALFKKVPGELIKMNFELDGTFPAHQPDPLQFDTLKDLQAKVLDVGADLGLAPDGDGDRLFFIDEKGQIVSASLITALVARELLNDHPGETVLADIRYILTPKKIIEESGGKFILTKVGHAFITEKMHETGAIFGGESSGHYFFRETGNAESQIPIILTVLKVMTRENRKLSEIIEGVKRSKESGEINFRVKNPQEILTALKEQYKKGELNDLDGVAISYPDWRFSVRTSNTEPLLRLNVEADVSGDIDSKKEELVNFIENHAVLENVIEE